MKLPAVLGDGPRPPVPRLEEAKLEEMWDLLTASGSANGTGCSQNVRRLMAAASKAKRKKAPDVGRKNTRRASAKLDRLIEEALVDAYGEEEQRMGFYTMLEDHLAMPFTTELLGVEVTVQRVDLTDDEQIVAVCARGRLRQAIPILALPLPDPPPPGAEWIQAYRRWVRGAVGETD